MESMKHLVILLQREDLEGLCPQPFITCLYSSAGRSTHLKHERKFEKSLIFLK